MNHNIAPEPKGAKELVETLLAQRLTCATAESCTGGLVCAAITAIPGVSQVFFGGAVTYTNPMKQLLLGVQAETLERFSAVSSQTAAEMAAGIRSRTGADIGVSVTGNAGPAPSEGKPVGLVYIGVDSLWHSAVEELHLSGTREEIRTATVKAALEQLLTTAQQHP